MVGTRGGLGRIVAMAVALAVVALLVLAGTARAGVYRVAQCGWGVGAELDPVQATVGNGFFLGPAFCTPPPGVEPQGLRFEAAPGGENDPGMARARWLVPPGDALVAVRGNWAGSMQPGFEATLGADVGPDFRPLASATGSTAYGPVAADMPGSAWGLEVRLGCGGGAVARCSRTRTSWLLLNGVTLSVLDPFVPTTRATGSLLENGWRRGAALLEAGAEDPGSGIQRLEATVDGAPVLAAPQTCAALPIEGEVRGTQLRPCPATASRTVEVDTSRLADGAHTVRACAVDFAAETGCAPEARIEVDNSAPALAFAGAQEGSVAATVSDPFSGPAGGTISVRRADAETWTDLPTALAAGASGTATLTARLPELSAGTWLFRAAASDTAGNAGSTQLKVAGSPDEVRRQVAAGGKGAAEEGNAPGSRHGGARPARPHGGRPTHVRAGLRMAGREDASAPATSGPGRGYRLDRHRGPSGSALTVAFGAAVEVRGRLTDAGGAALGGRTVEVISQAAPGAVPRRTIRHLLTADDGRFELRLPAGPSRRVVVAFAGGDDLASSRSRPLALRVGAAVSLTASPHRLATGETVHLGGRVRPGRARIPRRGKVVAIQYLERASGDWRPALVVRTDARGRFHVRYRFRYVTGRARIRLRATALPEAGWPYAEGSSPPLTIAVHG